MNALCGATAAAAAFEDLLVVDLELLLPELVVDLKLLLPELLAPLALLLKIVGEVEGLNDGANTSMVGAGVSSSLVGAGVSSSLVGAGVSVSDGLGVVNGSDVGVKGSGDGEGVSLISHQKGRIIEPSRISLHDIMDGSVYDGQWRNNKFDGYGTYKHIDGSTIKGQWKEGILQRIKRRSD